MELTIIIQSVLFRKCLPQQQQFSPAHCNWLSLPRPCKSPCLELSSSVSTKASVSVSSDDISSRSSWNAYTNGDLSPRIDYDENSSFGAAAPFFKSFMQVGSRFGESTMKLGSMLIDGQVRKFKDKSAPSMLGEILPVQAAGNRFSSFTTTRSDY